MELLFQPYVEYLSENHVGYEHYSIYENCCKLKKKQQKTELNKNNINNNNETK